VILELVAHAATPAQRRLRFPLDDDPLEDTEQAAPASSPPSRLARAAGAGAGWRGPERAAAATAERLGLASRVDPALRGWWLGDWAGRDVAGVAAGDPAGFAAWRLDPDATPGGGEPLRRHLATVAAWMERRATEPARRVVAVVAPTVVRAGLVHALGAGPEAFWRLDVAPLTVATVHHPGPGRAGEGWRVRTAGVPAGT
jgi:broad specificity phosphatase PhoE